MTIQRSRVRSRSGSELEGAIFFWLHQAHHAMRREILARFQERGYALTPEQWALLMSLWVRDGRSQAELARATARDEPSVTRLLDGLEEQRLVAREPNPADRRSYRVVLTAGGRRLHEQLRPVVADVMARAVAGLGAAQKRAVRAALRQIRENLASEP